MTEDDPLWYRDAAIYELHVRAFHDSGDDGVGDFRGVTEKLDYLRDLGVSVLWLLAPAERRPAAPGASSTCGATRRSASRTPA
jgi:hypothetical protein